MIWESVYNGYNAPIQDSWEIVNVINGNFWVYVSESAQGSGVIQNFNSTLNDWINNSPVGQIGDPQVTLTSNTYITGVNVGVGSWWGNTFLGYVDSVRVGFGLNDDNLYNFEMCASATTNNNPDVLFENSFECIK